MNAPVGFDAAASFDSLDDLDAGSCKGGNLPFGFEGSKTNAAQIRIDLDVAVAIGKVMFSDVIRPMPVRLFEVRSGKL